MDDHQFGKASAMEWIEIIEGKGNQIREADLYPYLHEWLMQTKPRTILDVGCGQGSCAAHIDHSDCVYTGVDPSPFLLQRAKELNPDNISQFIHGNAYSLPFEACKFDAAFSIAVWHLLENKQLASHELSRVLRENGKFLIVAANPDSYGEWIRNYAMSKREGLKFEGTNRLPDGTSSTDVLFLHSLDEIVAHLQAADLYVEETHVFRTALALKGQKRTK